MLKSFALVRFWLVFSFAFFAFASASTAAETTQEKQWIYKQLQARLTTARNEQTELRSYLQNAIDNVQLLEITQEKLMEDLAKSKKELSELTLNLKNCNDYSMRLATANRDLQTEFAESERKRAKMQKQRRVGIIAGIVAGSAILAAGGLAIGLLAVR